MKYATLDEAVKFYAKYISYEPLLLDSLRSNKKPGDVELRQCKMCETFFTPTFARNMISIAYVAICDECYKKIDSNDLNRGTTDESATPSDSTKV